MLISVLKDAIERLATNKTAQERVRNSQQLEANISKVVQSVNAMDKMLKTVDKAKQLELMRIELGPIIRNDLISTMRSVLEQAEDGFLDNEVVRTLDRNAADLKAHLDHEWNGAVSEEARQVTSSLDTFGRFMPNSDEATSLKQTINSRIQALPPSGEEVSAFATNLKKGREIADQAGDDPEIKVFIRKILDNQADLADITPGVEKWVKEHNLERRIKISFL